MPDRFRLRNNFGFGESDEAAGRLPRKFCPQISNPILFLRGIYAIMNKIK